MEDILKKEGVLSSPEDRKRRNESTEDSKDSSQKIVRVEEIDLIAEMDSQTTSEGIPTLSETLSQIEVTEETVMEGSTPVQRIKTPANLRKILQKSTPGMGPLMYKYYKEIKELHRLRLCGPPVPAHVTQRGGYGQKWSCGYRNIQMMSTALMEASSEYREALFDGDGVVPDVPELQAWIERAWRAGFDVEGGKQLNFLLQNTSTWIGATECAALFRFFGFRAIVVDFPSSAASYNGSAAPAGTGYNAAMPKRVKSWLEKYYVNSDAGAVLHTLAIDGGEMETDEFLSPVYFQNMGHSVTIAGVELAKGGFSQEVESAIVFDPEGDGKAAKNFLEKKTDNRWRRLLLQSVRTLSKPNYQVVYIAPGLMGPEERERSKRLSGHQDTSPLIWEL